MENIKLLLAFISVILIVVLVAVLDWFAVGAILKKYGRIRPRRHDDRVPLTRNQEQCIWMLVSILFVAWFLLLFSFGLGETVGSSIWKSLLWACVVTLLTPNRSFFGIFILLIYNYRKRKKAKRIINGIISPQKHNE